MSFLSQRAKLADSPKLGFTLDFSIYRLIQMPASARLSFSGTAGETERSRRGSDLRISEVSRE